VKRFVFLHRGGDPPPRDIASLDTIEGLHIVDRELARALLVEASDEAIDRAREILRGWTISEEAVYATPSPAKPSPAASKQKD
jgi:hypothetical protein